MPPAGTDTLVLPVHNRRDTTLRCLRHLRDTGVFDWARVIVVDDGSTDGTGAAVRAEFPQISLLAGDGNLWWTGAIALGMRHAFEAGAQTLLWLNDDCQPEPGTLNRLVALSRRQGVIAVGQARTPSGYIYGGFRKTGTGLQPVTCPSGEICECDAFTGNCVAIPRAVVEAIGFPDALGLRHNLGDVDYGLRARRAGFGCRVDGDALCRNDDNLKPAMRSWLLSDVPLLELWKQLVSIRSMSSPPSLRHYYWRHWGPAGLYLFARPYGRLALISLARVAVPRSWLIQLYGKKSWAYQSESHYRSPKKPG